MFDKLFGPTARTKPRCLCQCLKNTNTAYDLQRTCDDIRPDYYFDETCQGYCPEAIIAFLDSEDYESAIRLAVSLGGDSDTIACMTGGIAAAFYGIPDWIVEKGLGYIPQDMKECLDIVHKMISKNL